MSEKNLRMIVGLGNPGDAYKNTRHNIGFMLADAVAEYYAIPFDKKKADAIIGRGQIEGTEVILVKPMSYMNLSGFPARRIADYFRISGKDMVVVHDDIDLAFGRIKIKEKGGDGGHKGVRSLTDAFGGGDFIRLRIGVGRSEKEIKTADYVLGKFTGKEKEFLEQILANARDALVTVLCKGTKEGMNLFNCSKSIINL